MEKNSGNSEKGVKIIQWHPAFCSAMRLELRANKRELQFQNEYNLGKKPLQVDLLVIKKADHVRVDNEIGRIFRRYNLLEYKSPEDELGVAEFYKVIAYGCLYKAQEDSVDEILETEITLTIVRDSKPVKLLKWLRRHNYPVRSDCAGIYYIGEIMEFPVQLIVGNELSEENHVWLTSLKKGMNQEQMYNLVVSAIELSEKNEKEDADAVLDAAVRANPFSFPDVEKEESGMCEALLELMKPKLDEVRESGHAAGVATGMVEGRTLGRSEGRTEGRAEGKEEERRLRIAKAREMGFSEKDIEELFFSE